MSYEIKCSCGKVHTSEELTALLPDDEIELTSEIDCLACPICKDIELEPDDEYPEEFVEEEYEQEDKTGELDDQIDKTR